MVQRLQTARRELLLASVMDKLDKYDLLILDDISHVRKDQAETSVLFELVSVRYQCRSAQVNLKDTARNAFWDNCGEINLGRTETHNVLTPVYNWFTEGFDTPVLQEAKALLEQLTA